MLELDIFPFHLVPQVQQGVICTRFVRGRPINILDINRLFKPYLHLNRINYLLYLRQNAWLSLHLMSIIRYFDPVADLQSRP